MEITVNGKLRTVPNGMTIARLIEHFELGSERIAVEHNLRILEINDFEHTVVEDGDTLELVRFVGGG